jgi:diaminopimelate decarboxylase
VYDKKQIIENYTGLESAFKKYYPKTKIHYFVKANSNLHILKILNEADSGVDCSLPVELLLSRKVGFPKNKIRKIMKVWRKCRR